MFQDQGKCDSIAGPQPYSDGSSDREPSRPNRSCDTLLEEEEEEQHGENNPLISQHAQNDSSQPPHAQNDPTAHFQPARHQSGQGSSVGSIPQFHGHKERVAKNKRPAHRLRQHICCSIGVMGLLAVVLAVVLVATVLLIASACGLGMMYTHGKEKDYYLYTTADESNTVFSYEEVIMMHSACMIPRTTSQILYTSNCDRINELAKTYSFSDKVQPGKKVGYYFSFAAKSYVTVTFPHKQQGTASVKYLMEKDNRKAIDLDNDCEREGQEITASLFPEKGYYYICIIGSEDGHPISYTITVNENYYPRHDDIKECNNTIYHDGVKHMCCHFGLSETFAHHHCIYLTTRNTSPQSLEKPPESIKVYITYSETMETLAWVGTVVASLVIIGAILFSLIYYCCRRCRCTRKQGANPI